MNFVATVIGGIITVLILATLGALIFGWLVAILWNASLVSLFHFPEINWWMGTKLVWLTGLLFHSSGNSKD